MPSIHQRPEVPENVNLSAGRVIGAEGSASLVELHCGICPSFAAFASMSFISRDVLTAVS